MALIAYLGLGSNEGDRLGNLRKAGELLGEADGIELLARSSAYETEPVGEVLDQRDFLNAALRIETSLAPRELLDACKEVERRLGRPPGGPRHGPRPVDVDVLLYGDLTLAEDGLAVPHPELENRRFVLEPLAELDPDLMLGDGRTVVQALASLGEAQRVERVSDLG